MKNTLKKCKLNTKIILTKFIKFGGDKNEEY